ncbi:metallophosphoesterase [Pseudomonas sp. JQ170]|uniref:metallophosphoesterase n=1 Tax=unclassified Pseudomonas TaxID=196821 RepID=UPI0026507591|nr:MULTISPECIES: metallophosphoesterase [unclassified Pseudomonas]MDN7139968.1 metallophosphoesterase [Pseudomonas sp. JQ170]WRO78669.1 metallophosphoesterase [Pseudomonas sp. 170C]
MSRIERFAANQQGRDFAVGDIHGHFARLQAQLDVIAFNPRVDRLFSVGDLVDRGPECTQALHWLEQPWFHAVQGNHEALAVTHVSGGWLDYDQYRAAGGGWFLDLPASEQARFAKRFAQMPLALEIQTPDGVVGLLHADCPCASWPELCEQLQAGPGKDVQEYCQWSRRRLQRDDDTPVAGLRALIVGHTPLHRVRVLGNIWHIDTGGWSRGHFSLLELGTLTLANPMPGG